MHWFMTMIRVHDWSRRLTPIPTSTPCPLFKMGAQLPNGPFKS